MDRILRLDLLIGLCVFMYMGFSVYLHYKTFIDIQEYSDKIIVN